MIPCPNCKEPIGLDLGFIIKNPVSQCPHCEVVMKFPQDKKIFEEYISVLNEIENIKRKYKGAVFGGQENKNA